MVTSWKTSGATAFLLEKGKVTSNAPQGLPVNEEVLCLQAVTKDVVRGIECLPHPEALKIGFLSKPFKGI